MFEGGGFEDHANMRGFIFYVLFERRELSQKRTNLRKRELAKAILIARQIWLDEDDDEEQ